MDKHEVLKLENENAGNINMVKEGLFWRCYENSAWLFSSNVTGFRAIKRYSYVANREIVCFSIGNTDLPSVINTLKEKGGIITESDKVISVQGFPSKEGFEKWKAEIPIAPPIKSRKRAATPVEIIIGKIQKYSFANNTLDDVFEFLAYIQNEIKTHVLTNMKAVDKPKNIGK